MKEEGFEAEIVRMSSTVQVAALTAGEADYVTGMSALRGAIQGLPLKVIASYIQGSTHPEDGLVTATKENQREVPSDS